jgi:hypothetical protein
VQSISDCSRNKEKALPVEVEEPKRCTEVTRKKLHAKRIKAYSSGVKKAQSPNGEYNASMRETNETSEKMNDGIHEPIDVSQFRLDCV